MCKQLLAITILVHLSISATYAEDWEDDGGQDIDSKTVEQAPIPVPDQEVTEATEATDALLGATEDVIQNPGTPEARERLNEASQFAAENSYDLATEVAEGHYTEESFEEVQALMATVLEAGTNQAFQRAYGQGGSVTTGGSAATPASTYSPAPSYGAGASLATPAVSVPTGTAAPTFSVPGSPVEINLLTSLRDSNRPAETLVTFDEVPAAIGRAATNDPTTVPAPVAAQIATAVQTGVNTLQKQFPSVRVDEKGIVQAIPDGSKKVSEDALTQNESASKPGALMSGVTFLLSSLGVLPKAVEKTAAPATPTRSVASTSTRSLYTGGSRAPASLQTSPSNIDDIKRSLRTLAQNRNRKPAAARGAISGVDMKTLAIAKEKAPTAHKEKTTEVVTTWKPETQTARTPVDRPAFPGATRQFIADQVAHYPSPVIRCLYFIYEYANFIFPLSILFLLSLLYREMNRMIARRSAVHSRAR